MHQMKYRKSEEKGDEHPPPGWDIFSERRLRIDLTSESKIGYFYDILRYKQVLYYNHWNNMRSQTNHAYKQDKLGMEKSW